MNNLIMWLKIMFGKLLFKITGSKKIKTIKDVDYLSGEAITKLMYAVFLYIILQFFFGELVGLYHWFFPEVIINKEFQYLFF